MPRQRDYSDLSQLERELELEMDDGSSEEFELESSGETDDHRGYESEALDEEFEEDDAAERLLEQGNNASDPRSGEFVERLMEIGAREFESAAEVDQAMNEVLDDMEREYLFGSLRRGLKKLGKSSVLRSLARKGLSIAGGKLFPGLQGALQLARGNVKGALLNFGKQALGSVVPGGAVALDALKSVGLGGGEAPADDRETWENYVDIAREAYEHLADHLTPTADRPVEANRLANDAVQHALRQAQARVAGGQRSGGGRNGRPARVVRLRVAPGERIRLVIVGA